MFAMSLISPALYLWLIHWASWWFFIWQRLGKRVVVSRGEVFWGAVCIYSDRSISHLSATKSI